MTPKVTSAQTDWALHADLYAFLGNSLLAPLRPDAAVGLDPAFWDVWACDGENEHVHNGISTLKKHAARLACVPPEQAVQQVNVEFARLFVGPPKPAAPPWETLNRNPEATCGFGEATFAMRTLLREAGLCVQNENHQYEDHLGIELLYLSEERVPYACTCQMSRRLLPGLPNHRLNTLCDHLGIELLYLSERCRAFAQREPSFEEETAVREFVQKHPLAWIPAFHARIRTAAPHGYFDGLVELAWGLLEAEV